MLNLINLSNSVPVKVGEVDCIQEECAWYSSLGGRCSITGADEELHWIAERLHSIAEAVKTYVK